MNLLKPFVLALCLYCSFTFGQSHFDKKEFYSTLSKGDLSAFSKTEKNIPKTHKYEAFLGALLMKKADLVSNTSEKLKLFNTGREKLETANYEDSTCVEWRFLRIMIQENAPKLMRYNHAIEADALYLRGNYLKLDAEALSAFYSYCNVSKILKLNELKK